LCWITAGAALQAGCPACGYLLSCTHLFKGYCRSGFQCLGFTPSHVSFRLQSLFHWDRGPKALLLEYLYSREHWLRCMFLLFWRFTTNIIVLDGKVGDLWVQLHNANGCNYMF